MLENGEIAQIKGMLKRVDKQSDIAAWFGCNSGRIAEVHTGQRGAEVRPAASGLPPPGPYVVIAKSQVQDLDRFVRAMHTREARGGE